MSDVDVEVCVGCGHLIALHYEDVRKVVRCVNVERGTSSSGVIGLPYEIRCDCANYESAEVKRKQREDEMDHERVTAEIRRYIEANKKPDVPV